MKFFAGKFCGCSFLHTFVVLGWIQCGDPHSFFHRLTQSQVLALIKYVFITSKAFPTRRAFVVYGVPQYYTIFRST